MPYKIKKQYIKNTKEKKEKNNLWKKTQKKKVKKYSIKNIKGSYSEIASFIDLT